MRRETLTASESQMPEGREREREVGETGKQRETEREGGVT